MTILNPLFLSRWLTPTSALPSPPTRRPPAGLTLDDAGRAALERLRPLLALPADALLQQLLDGGPDGRPIWWGSYPSLDAYLE